MKNEATSSALDKAYSELVAAVVKAVPEIGENKTEDNAYGIPPYEINARPITLEDILRAIDSQHNKNILYAQAGYLASNENGWTLGHDLAWHKENAPETITFLHTLLCA